MIRCDRRLEERMPPKFTWIRRKRILNRFTCTPTLMVLETKKEQARAESKNRTNSALRDLNLIIYRTVWVTVPTERRPTRCLLYYIVSCIVFDVVLLSPRCGIPRHTERFTISHACCRETQLHTTTWLRTTGRKVQKDFGLAFRCRRRRYTEADQNSMMSHADYSVRRVTKWTGMPFTGVSFGTAWTHYRHCLKACQ